MSGYQFTPQAEDDLFEIWSYIAVENGEAANRAEDAVHVACALLVNTPLAGRLRENLTDRPVRFWLVQPFRNCWTVYRSDTKPLQIIRILHSSRNIALLLPRRRAKAQRAPFSEVHEFALVLDRKPKVLGQSLFFYCGGIAEVAAALTRSPTWTSAEPEKLAVA